MMMMIIVERYADPRRLFGDPKMRDFEWPQLNINFTWNSDLRVGYCSSDIPPVTEMFTAEADDKFCGRVLGNNNHSSILSERPHSQYNTRSRPHNKTLVAKTVNLMRGTFSLECCIKLLLTSWYRYFKFLFTPCQLLVSGITNHKVCVLTMQVHKRKTLLSSRPTLQQ